MDYNQNSQSQQAAPLQQHPDCELVAELQRRGFEVWKWDEPKGWEQWQHKSQQSLNDARFTK